MEVKREWGSGAWMGVREGAGSRRRYGEFAKWFLGLVSDEVQHILYDGYALLVCLSSSLVGSFDLLELLLGCELLLALHQVLQLLLLAHILHIRIHIGIQIIIVFVFVIVCVIIVFVIAIVMLCKRQEMLAWLETSACTHTLTRSGGLGGNFFGHVQRLVGGSPRGGFRGAEPPGRRRSFQKFWKK